MVEKGENSEDKCDLWVKLISGQYGKAKQESRVFDLEEYLERAQKRGLSEPEIAVVREALEKQDVRDLDKQGKTKRKSPNITDIKARIEDDKKEKKIDIADAAAERQYLMETCPEGLAVRGVKAEWDEQNKKVTVLAHSNLDGSASILFLKKVLGFDRPDAAPEEKAWVNKIHYVPPGEYVQGAFNLDTSWERVSMPVPGDKGGRLEGVAGIWKAMDASGQEITKPTLAIDHHAFDSPRVGSTLELLYNYYRKTDSNDVERIYDKEITDSREKRAWENFVKFVSAVDSMAIPQGMKITWEELWEEGDRVLFSLALNLQHEMAGKTEQLFEFFKTHKLEDAFKPLKDGDADKILGPFDYTDKRGKTYKNKFSERQIKQRQIGERFFEQAKGFTIFSETHGKILLTLGGEDKPNKLAVFGHGYDVQLVWRPGQNEFYINVKSDKPLISYHLYERFGKDQAVWTRGGLLIQPAWRSQANQVKRLNAGLLEVLQELGVETDTLRPQFKEKIIQAESCWSEKNKP